MSVMSDIHQISEEISSMEAYGAEPEDIIEYADIAMRAIAEELGENKYRVSE